jgi:hypothetical protein
VVNEWVFGEVGEGVEVDVDVEVRPVEVVAVGTLRVTEAGDLRSIDVRGRETLAQAKPPSPLPSGAGKVVG